MKKINGLVTSCSGHPTALQENELAREVPALSGGRR
jgi:hypothetical protein